MTIEEQLIKSDFHFYENPLETKPEHKANGKYRRFKGKKREQTYITPDGQETKVSYHTGGIEGCDIYCKKCNHYSTLKNKSILYGILGNCKKCNHSFLD